MRRADATEVLRFVHVASATSMTVFVCNRIYNCEHYNGEKGRPSCGSVGFISLICQPDNLRRDGYALGQKLIHLRFFPDILVPQHYPSRFIETELGQFSFFSLSRSHHPVCYFHSNLVTLKADCVRLELRRPLSQPCDEDIGQRRWTSPARTLGFGQDPPQCFSRPSVVLSSLYATGLSALLRLLHMFRWATKMKRILMSAESSRK